MAYGKGKDYYKSTYTADQLWEMLHAGDDWAVEQGGSIWTTAASGMTAAREELVSHVRTLRTQWTGAAADEFEERMALVEEYSTTAEDGMKLLGEIKMPELAGALRNAQTSASDADLYPSSTQTYEEWLDSNGHSETDSDYQTKKPQYEQQYEQYLDGRHEQMAVIVAELGETYAMTVEKDPAFREPPSPPGGMPGNTTYQSPTGGVFAESALDSPGGGDGPAGAEGLQATSDVNGDGVINDDDLEPVSETWNYGSYDDTDAPLGGGLASGGLVPAGSGYVPGGGPSVGGGGIPGGGTGLFGPSTGSGAGNTPGRGTGGNTSPARAGASNSSSKPGSGSGNRGGSGRGLSQSSRNAIRGGGSGNPRGGTRSGYSDDDEDETYTRETWLREDDVDWSRNNVRREELDSYDDDDD